MKERPILFSGPMVRAIQEGRKTQTRRVIKPQPVFGQYDSLPGSLVCSYGQPGDLLWVKETFCAWYPEKNHVSYRADYHPDDEKMVEYSGNKIIWKPSRYMPKKYARLWLRITNVRVERVQEISEADAKLEGMEAEWRQATHPKKTYRAGMQSIWDSLNAKRGYPWKSNPYVWVVEFERVK